MHFMAQLHIISGELYFGEGVEQRIWTLGLSLTFCFLDLCYNILELD